MPPFQIVAVRTRHVNDMQTPADCKHGNDEDEDAEGEGGDGNNSSTPATLSRSEANRPMLLCTQTYIAGSNLTCGL